VIVNGHTKAPRQPSRTARVSSRAASAGSPSERWAIGISRPPESRQKSAIQWLYARQYAPESSGSMSSASHRSPIVGYSMARAMPSRSRSSTRSFMSMVPNAGPRR
jgi:hypothetical protein